MNIRMMKRVGLFGVRVKEMIQQYIHVFQEPLYWKRTSKILKFRIKIQIE